VHSNLDKVTHCTIFSVRTT